MELYTLLLLVNGTLIFLKENIPETWRKENRRFEGETWQKV
jgi:hypothetical protein